MLPNKSALDIGLILMATTGVLLLVLLLLAVIVGQAFGQVLLVVLTYVGGFAGVALLLAALVLRGTAAEQNERQDRPWF
jgi:hypothetical protein